VPDLGGPVNDSCDARQEASTSPALGVLSDQRRPRSSPDSVPDGISRTIPSQLTPARRLPSGLKTTPRAWPMGPLKGRSFRRASRFQTFTAPSPPGSGAASQLLRHRRTGGATRDVFLQGRQLLAADLPVGQAPQVPGRGTGAHAGSSRPSARVTRTDATGCGEVLSPWCPGPSPPARALREGRGRPFAQASTMNGRRIPGVPRRPARKNPGRRVKRPARAGTTRGRTREPTWP
jgi:hypothetical protein